MLASNRWEYVRHPTDSRFNGHTIILLYNMDRDQTVHDRIKMMEDISEFVNTTLSGTYNTGMKFRWN